MHYLLTSAKVLNLALSYQTRSGEVVDGLTCVGLGVITVLDDVAHSVVLVEDPHGGRYIALVPETHGVDSVLFSPISKVA